MASRDVTISGTVGIKKGEVGAIQQLLKDSEIMKDQEKRERLFSRILLYVAQGIDMSVLFPQMIINASTKDYLEKKLIYQYLTYYAPMQSDLALLCVNTFRTDFQSTSPHIRGLALRSLSQLRVKSLLEYVIPCITAGLVDRSSYVRSVAVMSVLQLYYFSKESFDENKYFDTLFEMLRDSDPTVAGNCICVLNEILGNSVGNESVITKPLVIYLLNRMNSLNEWDAINLLNLIKNYSPSSEQEMYDIMNLLDNYFSSTNSGIVFAAAQVFLQLTHNYPSLQQDVAKQLVVPLINLMSLSPEIAFASLKHCLVMQERYGGLFNSYYTSFFWRNGDPISLKKLKLKMLELVACNSNYTAIINELNEYVLDESVGGEAVLCLGGIGVRVPACFDLLSTSLQSILSLSESIATRAVIITIMNILRRYPSAYTKFIPLLGAHFYSFDSIEAKCALIYILGQFGEHIPASPYLLEYFLRQLDTIVEGEEKDENSSSSSSTETSLTSSFSPNILGSEKVRLQIYLLSSLTRLLFLRPGEIQPILGKLLADIISNAPQGIVRDKALFTYRLLRDNYSLAKEIFLDKPEKMKKAMNEKIMKEKDNSDVGLKISYAEDESNVIKEQVWKEWGTFSVIYGHTQKYFTIPITQSLGLKKLVKEAKESSSSNSSSTNSAPLTEPTPSIPVAKKIFSIPNSPCTAPHFQELWKGISQSFIERMPHPSEPTVEQWKQSMVSSGYTVVAIGKKDGLPRMFVYTLTNDKTEAVAEILATAEEIVCTVKCANAEFGSDFSMTLLSCFI